MPKIPGNAELENWRHERFAQKCASGMSHVGAYRDAGYAATTDKSAVSAACNLFKRDDIRARIDRLVLCQPGAVLDRTRKLEMLTKIAETAIDQRIQILAIQEHNKLEGEYEHDPKVPSPSGNLTADELSQMIAAARVIKRQGEDFMSEHARRPVRPNTDNSGFEDVSDDDVS